MIHFKNRNNGFTFIEVVLAMGIVALLLTSLFTLQNTMFTNVINSHFKISRLYLIKNFLFDSGNLEKSTAALKKMGGKIEPIEKKLDEPQMTLKYQLVKPNEKSLSN